MVVRKLCGTCQIEPFIIDGSQPLVFALRSNYEYEGTGATLRFTKVTDSPTPNLSETVSNIDCKIKCDPSVRDCGGQCNNQVFTSSSGTLTSHVGYGNVPYDPRLTCEFIVDLRNS